MSFGNNENDAAWGGAGLYDEDDIRFRPLVEDDDFDTAVSPSRRGVEFARRKPRSPRGGKKRKATGKKSPARRRSPSKKSPARRRSPSKKSPNRSKKSPSKK